jgi:phosphopantothenate-cysteine ligase
MSSDTKTPESKIRVSNVGDKVKRGDGIKWQSFMNKLAFESSRIKKKTRSLSDSSNRKLLEQIPSLPENEMDQLIPLLQAFTTRHQSHHRPIALVTSGGTATDLEVRAVRYLDNFSTGLRGATSVEEFLKRGYAVIHLWREGSAAPYSRILSQVVGSRQGNHAISFDALGKMFANQNEDDGLNGTDPSGSDPRYEDPWLTSTDSKERSKSKQPKEEDGQLLEGDDSTAASSIGIKLSKLVLNSTILQTKLRERADASKGGMLLTVPFRTVEQYLAKLKLCTEAINDCQSLGLIYLTAAVSDFYIPDAQKSQHKIQSRDYGIQDRTSQDPVAESAIRMDPVTNCLHLKLSPVPKMLSLVRDDFAPNAFCVSFKLETDKDILFEKAKIAINKYDMHMVIGNVLETRYDKVWILQNRSMYVSSDDGNQNESDNKVTVSEVSKNDAPSTSDDALEDAMVSHVVEKHFEYIANHFLVDENGDGSESNGVLPRTALMAGAEAAARHNEYLKEKKRQLQNDLYWKRVRDNTLTVAGHALGMYLTYVASSALQKRLR